MAQTNFMAEYVIYLFLKRLELNNWAAKAPQWYVEWMLEFCCVCQNSTQERENAKDTYNSHVKGTQAWDNFKFFWPKSDPYMP